MIRVPGASRSKRVVTVWWGSPPHTTDAEDPYQPGDLVPADVVGPARLEEAICHLRVLKAGVRHRPRPMGVVGARSDRHVVLTEHSTDRP